MEKIILKTNILVHLKSADIAAKDVPVHLKSAHRACEILFVFGVKNMTTFFRKIKKREYCV